jgi:hypothetical protein
MNGAHDVAHPWANHGAGEVRRLTRALRVLEFVGLVDYCSSISRAARAPR